ncbi:MAG: flagellar motor switch protein FliM [Verrucomicrobia bacterium]|nr:flagellar motor switch protein FliM [Verrucomicrobiota bacterium]
MSDILSQDEIDALLGAVASGQVAVEQDAPSVIDRSTVMGYDFRRPKLISKDQMRTLHMLNDTFAKSFANTLSLYLRTIVNANLALVEQFTYGEFIMSLPNPTCMSVFSMQPLEGLAILEINPVLVFVIVDRLMGGGGQPPKEIRELTEIENQIILTVINMALDKFQETWKHVTQLRCALEGRESNPQFAQVTTLTDNVLLITLNVEIGENTGMASLCIPIATLAPVLGYLSAQKWISSGQRAATAAARQCAGFLEETDVELQAVLGTARMTLNELVSMQSGDVIVLDRHAEEDVVLNVESAPKFIAKPGLVAGRRGVRIIGPHEN